MGTEDSSAIHWGTEIVVSSDHYTLRWIMSVSYPYGRLARWRLGLSNFLVSVSYLPGLENQVPDALPLCAPNDREDRKVEAGIDTF